MNEKLNIQDIVRLLAERNGITKKDSEAFVKEFFLLIEEGLEKDNYVKIKGLGTFRLTEVGSRESVNVNTGERFKIEGHTKVSFTPESSLKDTINKPFAHFETVVLNENTILDDTPVETVSEENEQVLLVSEELKNEPAVIEEAPESVAVSVKEIEGEEADKLSAEEIIAAEMHNVEQVSVIEENVAEEPVIPINSDSIEKERPSEKVNKVDKSAVTYLAGIIIVVLLLCGGALLFIYYPDIFSSAEKRSRVETKQSIEETPRVPGILADTVKADTVAQTVAAQKTEITHEKKTGETVGPVKRPRALLPVEPDSVNYVIVGTKTMYTIKEGETLTRVSLRFYGTKDLWPYIVKHNRDVIKNPDRVPYGTTLKIPELAKK